MKVVITGGGGQLALAFKAVLPKNNKNWIFLSSSDLDITDEHSVLSYFKKNCCDFIINCAAYTDVNKAEIEPELAFRVNEIGVKNLVKSCNLTNTKLIHYSTDYVFDGQNNYAYKESDKTCPINVYGKSKLAGENAIINSSIPSIIIRTSWVYSTLKKNFLTTMLNLANNNNNIKVVDDQFGSPTSAFDLARATISIINSKHYNWRQNEIFNYSNEGSCSWYEFACEIFNNKEISVNLSKIKSSKLNKDQALRPKYSLLDKCKIKKTFNLQIKDWKNSLISMLKKEY